MFRLRRRVSSLGSYQDLQWTRTPGYKFTLFLLGVLKGSGVEFLVSGNK